MSQIQGWYYLHENKDLIYKNSPDAIIDIRESDLCYSAWAWDGTRPTAWQILVEALALGAKKERIQGLAEKWGCDNADAEHYANYLGIDIGLDGQAYYARRSDFENLQESPIGFGESYLQALAEFAKTLGYRGGTMWPITFIELLKNK